MRGAHGGPAPSLSKDGNNCNEHLSGSQSNYRKTAAALQWNVEAFIRRHGLERVGFLTLTFAEDIQDPKEAQRRFHSLCTGVLTKLYPDWIRVFERTKKGRIHYHLLVALSEDVRTGFDFETHLRASDARDRGDLEEARSLTATYSKSASPALRAEWKRWGAHGVQRQYGFGRAEMLPVRKTGMEIARYISKYISKHVAARLAIDKGVRLVAYSKGAQVANCRFSWNSPSARVRRRKLSWIAGNLLSHEGPLIKDYGDFKRYLGKRWGYEIRDLLPLLLLPFSEYWVCGAFDRQCHYYERDRSQWDHVPDDEKALQLSKGYVLSVLWRIQREWGYDPDRERRLKHLPWAA